MHSRCRIPKEVLTESKSGSTLRRPLAPYQQLSHTQLAEKSKQHLPGPELLEVRLGPFRFLHQSESEGFRALAVYPFGVLFFVLSHLRCLIPFSLTHTRKLPPRHI